MPKSNINLPKLLRFITLWALLLIVWICGTVSFLMLYRFISLDISMQTIVVKVYIIVSMLIFLFMIQTVSAISAKSFIMQPTPSRIVLFNSDVKIILNCSSSTASRKIKEAKDALAKQEHQEISIREFCNYFGLDFIESCQLLKLI